MSEHEARLKRKLTNYPSDIQEALEALLIEHRAALSRARAEALEEAAQRFDRRAALYDSFSTPALTAKEDAKAIRALITSPAPATIPVERVREVLAEVRDVARSPGPIGITYARAAGRLDAVEQVSAALGVDLDAKGEAAAKPTGGIDLHALASCRHGRVWPEQCPECKR